jgi:inosine-uridine nucleoside N-ribohydrolase
MPAGRGRINIDSRLLAIAASLVCSVAEARSTEIADLPNVIFDTDMDWSDIDDTMALARLHALHDRHEINLVAVTVSAGEKWCASYTDVIDTFYGHPWVRIGINHGGLNALTLRQTFPSLADWPSPSYQRKLSQSTGDKDIPVYPHRLIDGAAAPEAVSLLRQTLVAQPDASVVMIQVGYSTNLARLLDSPADTTSVLDGHDLIRRKVRLLSVMAGSFSQTTNTPEFNLKADVPAAQKVFSEWPTPIVASGGEIGSAMPYPGLSIEHDFAYVEHHPVAEAYRLFCDEFKVAAPNAVPGTCPHNHPTFDLTAVLYAARPDRGYCSLSKAATITILADGSSRFEESANGRHHYLILTDQQKGRTLEAIVTLVSQPPSVATSPKPSVWPYL